MEPKEFIKREVASGKSQTEIANKIGVSNATIYKILYTNTQLTLATIRKIAKAYGKPLSFFVPDNNDIIAEEGTHYTTVTNLSKKELRLLTEFRNLDDRRQDRILDTIEDMVLALRESGERGSPEKDSKEPNSKRNSNG